ncbi:MAG TPA: response regulator [Chloroflexia bacterium]|nr:response regulator [Chloroflexia bacterium]
MIDQGARILLADDDPDILMLISFCLQRAGFNVILAENGQEALDKAVTENPDMIILDRMMPGMDGIEVCRKLRQNSNEVFIVMLTAMSSDEDRIKGLEAGADDYIGKPFNSQELVLRLKAIMRRGRNPVAPAPVATYAYANRNQSAGRQTTPLPAQAVQKPAAAATADKTNSAQYLPALLKEASKAAQGSNVKLARELYLRVLKLESTNEQALMWLAWYAEDPYEGCKYLERLVAAHPENARAREFLEAGRSKIEEVNRLISDSSMLNYWTIAEQVHIDRIKKGQDRRTAPVTPIGQLLLQKGFITDVQLETAVSLHEMFSRLGAPKKLGEVLLEYGYLNKEQLSQVLHEQQADFESQFY